MNIFQNIGAFYGADRDNESEPLLAIFRLAKRIRLRLGTKGYLLDNYLDLVFQGLNMGITSEAAEEGTEAAYRCQRRLLFYIVEGTEPETPHPLYEQIQKVYEQHSWVQTFQESQTRVYLLMALSANELMEYAISEFIAKQEQYQVGSEDIFFLRELYDKIILFVDEPLMEELNGRLRQWFQGTSLLSAFIQGYANDLLFQLTWRDYETSRQVFQLLLDHLPENE